MKNEAFEAGKFDETDKQLTAFIISLQGLRLAEPAGLPFECPKELKFTVQGRDL